MNRLLDENYSCDMDASKDKAVDGGCGGGGTGAVLEQVVRPTLLSVSSKKLPRPESDLLRYLR